MLYEIKSTRMDDGRTIEITAYVIASSIKEAIDKWTAKSKWYHEYDIDQITKLSDSIVA